MAKVIIFGNRDLAELAWYYLVNDSEHTVCAFSVSHEYLKGDTSFHGLPLLSFEDIENRLSPDKYQFFVPMTHSGMNHDREKIYQQVKAKGYSLISYISSRATVFDREAIGENCFILEDNTIQPFVKIGNNVVLWSGNHIGHHSVIEDHVFITSHVVISGNCHLKSHCFLGVNASLKENISLGKGCFIAMFTPVMKDTEDYSVYTCQPAKKIEMSSLKIRF